MAASYKGKNPRTSGDDKVSRASKWDDHLGLAARMLNDDQQNLTTGRATARETSFDRTLVEHFRSNREKDLASQKARDKREIGTNRKSRKKGRRKSSR